MTYYRYVDTASAGGDGKTRSHSGATAAYASLSACLAAEATTLSDHIVIRCAGSVDDTVAASITGWTPGAYTITIAGDRGEDDSSGGGDNGSGFDNDGFYDGNFSFSDSHYALKQSSDFTLLSVSEENVIIDGIQVHAGKASSGAIGISAGYSDTIVKNCRVGCPNGTAILVSGSSFRSYPQEISNNIVYIGGVTGIFLARATNAADKTTNVYNNTIYDCGTGIDLSSSDNTGDTWNVKNNIVFNCTTEYSGLNSTNSTINATHNAGEGSAPTGHDSDWITLSATLTDDVTDPENAGGVSADDLRPVASGNLDGSGIGNSTDSNSPTVDITGNSRSGSAPSVGAFELQGSSGVSIDGNPAALSFSGQSGQVDIGSSVSGSIASLVFAGTQGQIDLGVSINGSPTAVSLTGITGQVDAGTGINSTIAALTMTGMQGEVSLGADVIINGNPASLSLTGAAGQADLGVSINGNISSLSLTGMQGQADSGVTITSSPAAMTMQGVAGDVSLGGNVIINGIPASLLFNRLSGSVTQNIVIDGQIASSVFAGMNGNVTQNIILDGSAASLIHNSLIGSVLLDTLIDGSPGLLSMTGVAGSVTAGELISILHSRGIEMKLYNTPIEMN